MATPVGVTPNFNPLTDNPPYGPLQGQTYEVTYGAGGLLSGTVPSCDTTPWSPYGSIEHP